jgi:hypothetical protein
MAHLDFIDPGNSGGSVSPQDSPFENLRFNPIIYSCPICKQFFNSPDSLFNHRLEAHPSKRPSLIIGGIETSSHPSRHVIVKSIMVREIQFLEVEGASQNDNPIPLDKLKVLLAEKKQGAFDFYLVNKTVKTHYSLIFEIPENADLVKIEDFFFEIIAQDTFNTERINLFAGMAGKLKSGIRYTAGLCDYLYGVLAKDQSGNTHLKHQDHVTKFNSALETLKHFDRPLSNTIVCIINLNMNVFEFNYNKFGSQKIMSSLLRFHQIVNDEKPISKFNENKTPNSDKRIPLDLATEKIINWSILDIERLMKWQNELEHLLKSTEWTERDKYKIRILLINFFLELGENSKAQLIIKDYKNVAGFSKLLARITT